MHLLNSISLTLSDKQWLEQKIANLQTHNERGPLSFLVYICHKQIALQKCYTFKDLFRYIFFLIIRYGDIATMSDNILGMCDG